MNEEFGVMTDGYVDVCQKGNRRGGGGTSGLGLAPIVKSQGEGSVVMDPLLAYDPILHILELLGFMPTDARSESPASFGHRTPPLADWTPTHRVLHMLELDPSGRSASTPPAVTISPPRRAPRIPAMLGLNDPAALQALTDPMSASMREDARALSGASMPPLMRTADTRGGALVARG